MAQPPPYSTHDPKIGFVPPGVAPAGPQFSSLPAQNTTNIHFSPPPMQGGNTVIVSPGVILTGLGPNPQPFTCQFCHQSTRTKVETETSTKTHLFALCMCLFLCWPCAWLPYCMDSCKSQNHYCSNCGAFVGSYEA